MKTLALAWTAISLLAAAPSLGGPAISGSVHSETGEPVHGALVTFTHTGLRRATTVYTDPSGGFRLPPLEAGTYGVRVRRSGFKDIERPGLRCDADSCFGPQSVERPLARLDFTLPVESDPRELAWQLPASRWMALLLARLSSDERREEFTRQCTYCHQQGNWGTRVERSREDWEKILKLMARMGGVVSPELRAELPDAFNAAYAENSYLPALTRPFRPVPPPDEHAAGAVITEWEVGLPASFQHDAAVDRAGRVWATDLNQDQLYMLDPRSSERRAWSIPRDDSPLGGVFNVTGNLIPPNSNAHVAPHSLQVAPDGTIWITLCLGNKMARFDPATEQWKVIKQKEGLYPHTLRFDRKGRIWYTLAVSNHVAMLDPATGEQRAIRLPARSWGQAVALRVLPIVLWAGKYVNLVDASASEGVNLPVPYGIDIAPDGGVWFSQLNERRIGRIDPDSLAVELIDTPFNGPRRLRFDSQGNLWIPGFSDGVVSRFELRTRRFKTWKLPIDGVETPYALNVDRKSDAVWICGTNSDSLLRFEPQSERFTVFPLPTRVTYTREIDFDAGGNVWTSNSNFPTWQIEGPGPKLIRLELAKTVR